MALRHTWVFGKVELSVSLLFLLGKHSLFNLTKEIEASPNAATLPLLGILISLKNNIVPGTKEVLDGGLSD